MGDPARERARQVASTANRLRLVQIDFADESPEVRQQYLVDEIERALSRTDPDQREAFLQELEYAFPTWDAWGSAPAPAAAPSAAPPTDAREDRDPSYHLRRLVELSAGLSAEEKAAIVERLRRAGLAPASGGDWPQEAAAALRERLRLPESAHVDPERTVELVSLLVHDLAGPLDDIVWRTWKQIAPRSDLRRGRDARTTTSKYVSGDPEVPRGQVQQDLEQLRRLIAGLIGSVGQAGQQIAQEYERKYSPMAIETLVPPSKWGRKEKLWDKYCELAPDVREREREIYQCIATFAESLIKGLGR